MTGDVLETHRSKRTRHQRPTKFTSRLMLRDEKDGKCHDVHSRFFVYSKCILLIVAESAWLGLLDFHEVDGSTTKGCGFFITVGCERPKPSDDRFRTLRMELLIRIMIAVRDQAGS
jgi:hypothetical protein